MTENSISCKELIIPVPWGHVAGKVWGDESGFPVLMLHGAHDNCNSFNYLLPHLQSNGFYYITLDLPGHGKSSYITKGLPIDLFNYIFCIELVINNLNLKKFSMLGHSLGAQLSLMYTAIYPEKVLNLILIEGLLYKKFSAEKSFKEIRKRFDRTIDILNTEKKTFSYDKILNNFLTKRPTKLSVENAEMLLQRNLIETSDDRFIISTDPRMKNSFSPLISEKQLMSIYICLKCPVFYILTKKSAEKLPPNLDSNFESINFKSLIVEGDHDLHINQPELISKEIVTFLLQIKSKL